MGLDTPVNWAIGGQVVGECSLVFRPVRDVVVVAVSIARVLEVDSELGWIFVGVVKPNEGEVRA